MLHSQQLYNAWKDCVTSIYSCTWSRYNYTRVTVVMSCLLIYLVFSMITLKNLCIFETKSRILTKSKCSLLNNPICLLHELLCISCDHFSNSHTITSWLAPTPVCILLTCSCDISIENVSCVTCIDCCTLVVCST